MENLIPDLQEYIKQYSSFIPLIQDSKLPKEKKWNKKGVRLEELFENFPECNYGILTGKKNNLCILDVDPKNNGDLSLATYESYYGKLDPLWKIKTPSGGFHYYFKYNEIFSKSHIGFLPGLDWLSDNRYAVCPPSSIMSHSYSFIVSNNTQCSHEIIPSTLQIYLNKPSIEHKIEEGSRNTKLYNIARKILCQHK